MLKCFLCFEKDAVLILKEFFLSISLIPKTVTLCFEKDAVLILKAVLIKH